MWHVYTGPDSVGQSVGSLGLVDDTAVCCYSQLLLGFGSEGRPQAPSKNLRRDYYQSVLIVNIYGTTKRLAKHSSIQALTTGVG